MELVDVFIDHGPAVLGTVVDLIIGDKHYSQSIRNVEDFGEEKLEFQVSEFPAGTRAFLKWKVNGHEQSQKQLIAPAKKWTLFLVPHNHLDVGFTDYQATVAAIQSRIVDQAWTKQRNIPTFVSALMGNGTWSNS